MSGSEKIYTDDVIKEMIERVSRGELISEICKENDKPSLMRFHIRVDENDDLHDMYVQARHDHQQVNKDKSVKVLTDLQQQADDGEEIGMARVTLARALSDALERQSNKYSKRQRAGTRKKLKDKTIAERAAIINDDYMNEVISEETARNAMTLLETQQKITDNREAVLITDEALETVRNAKK